MRFHFFGQKCLPLIVGIVVPAFFPLVAARGGPSRFLAKISAARVSVAAAPKTAATAGARGGAGQQADKQDCFS